MVSHESAVSTVCRSSPSTSKMVSKESDDFVSGIIVNFTQKYIIGGQWWVKKLSLPKLNQYLQYVGVLSGLQRWLVNGSDDFVE